MVDHTVRPWAWFFTSLMLFSACKMAMVILPLLKGWREGSRS